MEIVSGWSDERHVYFVERSGDDVRVRRLPARWSAFFVGLDDDDRKTLQRSREVNGLAVEGKYTRVDFVSKWARVDACRRIGEVFKGAGMALDAPEFSILEADVGPLRRALTDHGTIQVSANPRMGWFDLETDSRKSFADARDGKARILSWALVDDRGREIVEVLDEDTDAAERALVGRFFDAVRDLDVLLAWNGDGFDFPVLENRSHALRVRHANGRPPIWNRWCWLDAMQVFKKYNQAHDSGEERASFSLNAIANHVLGEGKDAFDASKTWEAWHAGGEERERLARYNLRDTVLLPRIEAKTGFVALHMAVCRVTRCVPDSASLGAAQQGDGFLLRLGAERGYRFATKVFRDGSDGFEKFAGAYVMEPRKLGVIDGVHVCDFAGLYPSIMRSWNMSPDTLANRFDVRSGKLSTVCKLPDRDVYFRTDFRGVIPLALDQLVAQRAEYTKRADAAEPGSEEWDRFKRLSSAFKIVANSFYGIVGSPFTRFFDRTIAEGVTQTGAWLIKHVARTSEAAGLIPFYGDTDSVFVEGDGDAFSRVVSTLNEGWPATLADMGCTESRIKLEYEKSFRRLVMVSAKRYAGKFAIYKGKVAPDGMKPEVKGLEYKRGDAIRLAREMQAEAIAMLLRPEIPDVGEFRAFVDAWRSRVLTGEVSREDLVLSQSVKDLDEYADRFTTAECGAKIGKGKSAVKCGHIFKYGVHRDKRADTECPKCGTPRKVSTLPAHVRVAKILAARGEAITAGSRVSYFVVTPGPDDDAGGNLLALPADDPGAFERVDRGYYWDSRVYPPTQRLLDIVYPGRGWDAPAVPKAPKPAKVEPDETQAKPKPATRKRKTTADVLPLFGDASDDGGR